MKIQKIHLSLLAAAGLSLFWVACQKEVSNSVNDQDASQNFKGFGAVKDNPDQTRLVPFIMSSTFKQSGASSTVTDVASKGKPTGGKGQTGSDVTAPSVAITSPANGSTVSGTVSVQVSASDNVGVASVTFSVDGSLVATSTSSPYNFSWNADAAADGNHTLSATAKDAAGNQSTSQIGVTKGTGGGVVVLPPSGSLPSNYRINMPAVGYQGSEGTCVTFAVVYYALSAEQYKKSGASSYSNASNVFSPEFVYNQTKASSSCSSGSSMINTLNFLYNNGSCTWQSMPYSSSDGCSTLPNSSQTAEAANYKVKNYSQVLSSDQTAIKTLLSSGHPLAFTFTADANFYNAGPGYIWNSYSSTIYGPHAITLCGYDDTKNAYLAINQWGTSWGDAGYIWIDYNFFTNITSGAYTLGL